MASAFQSRHAHRAVWPIHDLVLSDLLNWIAPTHPTLQLIRYIIVSVLLVAIVHVLVPTAVFVLLHDAQDHVNGNGNGTSSVVSFLVNALTRSSAVSRLAMEEHHPLHLASGSVSVDVRQLPWTNALAESIKYTYIRQERPMLATMLIQCIRSMHRHHHRQQQQPNQVAPPDVAHTPLLAGTTCRNEERLVIQRDVSTLTNGADDGSKIDDDATELQQCLTTASTTTTTTTTNSFFSSPRNNVESIMTPPLEDWPDLLVWLCRSLSALALLVWTYRQRRVVWLGWHTRVKRFLRRLLSCSFSSSAYLSHPHASWIMDPSLVEVHRLPMHVPLRFHTHEPDARKAACQPDWAHTTYHNDCASFLSSSSPDNVAATTKTTPPASSSSSPLTNNVWRLDSLDWKFRLFRSVQAALDRIPEASKVRVTVPPPPPTSGLPPVAENEVLTMNSERENGKDELEKRKQRWGGPAESLSFQSIPVPSNWMLQDNVDDIPIYTNIKYPWPCDPPFVPLDNPTGLYKLDFVLPHQTDEDGDDASTAGSILTEATTQSWSTAISKGGEVTLLLHGVESCVYVFLNGQFIGFSKDSRLPSEFSVTHALETRPHRINTLCLVVVRWSDGSYLEDQDHWWMAGLHRSVELCLRPIGADILDYHVLATAEGDVTCNVTCRSPGIKGSGGQREIVAFLYQDIPTKMDCTVGPNNEIQPCTVKEGPVVYKDKQLVPVLSGNSSVTLSGTVANPLLWTAETPSNTDVDCHLNFP